MVTLVLDDLQYETSWRFSNAMLCVFALIADQELLIIIDKKTQVLSGG